jgi:hypothetical protein
VLSLCPDFPICRLQAVIICKGVLSVAGRNLSAIIYRSFLGIERPCACVLAHGLDSFHRFRCLPPSCLPPHRPFEFHLSIFCSTTVARTSFGISFQDISRNWLEKIPSGMPLSSSAFDNVLTGLHLRMLLMFKEMARLRHCLLSSSTFPASSPIQLPPQLCIVHIVLVSLSLHIVDILISFVFVFSDCHDKKRTPSQCHAYICRHFNAYISRCLIVVL